MKIVKSIRKFFSKYSGTIFYALLILTCVWSGIYGDSSSIEIWISIFIGGYTAIIMFLTFPDLKIKERSIEFQINFSMVAQFAILILMMFSIRQTLPINESSEYVKLIAISLYLIALLVHPIRKRWLRSQDSSRK